ncbi:MAG: molybdopterin-dependent oxidoreductase, partial [Mucispirillum sp.]|nr:molybdopterin-dependent oxidoreductase [Mucispirillum sp.]
FTVPKTPEWASKITGVPADTIRELAELYANPESNILTEWCGGFQKQENGVINVFALSSLLCITKTFGKWGGGMYGPWASTIIGPDNENIAGSADDVDFIDTSEISAGRTGITGVGQQSVPGVSCTQWFNGIKLAFKDELAAGGYEGKHIPDWDQTDRYSNDDGGTKCGVVWKRNANGSIATYMENGVEYYDYEGRDTNSPVYAGTRMIISAAGGIPLNQHSNANDTAEMYKCLPVSGNPDNADTFCLVTFDVFLSPTARFADYVIPSTIALEAADTMSIGGETAYRPAILDPKGDAKSGWEWAYLAYKAQAELGNFDASGAVVPADAHLNYVKSEDGKYRSIEDIADKVVEEAVNDPSSRFYGMSKEQFYASQYVPRKNIDEVKTSDPYKNDISGKKRKNLENYLKNTADLQNRPFIFTKYGDGETKNEFSASVAYSWACNNNNTAGGITGRTDGNDRPAFTGRMQVYNNTAVWDYEHFNSKYHLWLPASKRGQSNTDFEGDAIVYPIPIYINFEDCFKEAYDGFSGGKNESFFADDGSKPLTMSTTHDRYRVHSTHAENPLMRELNHRVQGGGWASGNDWKEYVVMPSPEEFNAGERPAAMLSTAIMNKNKETASWHEIWMNTADARERGIADGDLCLVENPIGKVRVVARVTDRCMKGHLNLHQGSWYDPNPADDIDDGGCANTLISSKPSRYDRGNAQQFAYVKISKTSI